MSDSRQALWAIIEARDASLAELRATADTLRAELHRLQADLLEKEAARRSIDAAAAVAQADATRMVEELRAKQQVIEEMGRALRGYRATFAMLGFVIRPLARFVAFASRPIRIFTPRLGVLVQHEPIPMSVPAPRQAGGLATSLRISMVTPSYNQGRFIERTILSVLDQGYPRLEYFVQDGGSTDATRDILERYGDRLSGWDSRRDSGQSQAINRGFERTTGEIMGWLNSDDLLLPGSLASIAEYFHRHPDVDVVYGHRILIDEEDREIGRWILPPHDEGVMSWADFIPQETLFWRRRVWDKVGGKIDESFRFAMDWDLLIRFRDAGARFARIPRFLGAFRIHERQKTSAGIADVGFEEMNRIRERALGKVPSNVEVRRAVLGYLLRHVATDFKWRLSRRLGVER